VPALSAEGDKGSEIAETAIEVGRANKDRRRLRLIVRRQRTTAGQQLSFDDLDGWRFHAIVTNLPAMFAPAEMVEAHHRLRGGIPEDTIRQLKEDFGLIHAPVQNFFGNWLWWHACALAHNVARWIRDQHLPREFRRCRGKRLRLAFFRHDQGGAVDPEYHLRAQQGSPPRPETTAVQAHRVRRGGRADRDRCRGRQHHR
jgi:hypothetical protein